MVMLCFIVIFSNINVNKCEIIFEFLIAIAIKRSRILNYRGTFTKLTRSALSLVLVISGCHLIQWHKYCCYNCHVKNLRYAYLRLVSVACL